MYDRNLEKKLAARRKAQRFLQDMRDGIDPRAAKKAEEAEKVTLREVMEAYVSRPGKLKPSSKAEVRRHVEQVFVAWLDKPIAGVTEDDIRKRHREMATKGLRGKGPAPGQANLSMTTLRALINFASRQYRRADGSPLFLFNPVDVLKDHWAKLGTRTQRYIDKRTIGAVWNALHDARANSKNPDALAGIDLTLFLLLTGARRNEGAQLTWDRVNPVAAKRLRAMRSAMNVIQDRTALLHKELEKLVGKSPSHAKMLRDRNAAAERLLGGI